MRTSFDAHERHIADTIEALANVTITEGCDWTFTLFVAVIEDDDTDRQTRFECENYMSGLAIVARELRLDKQFSADLLAVGLRFDDCVDEAA